MVRIVEDNLYGHNADGNELHYIEGFCLSTDTKTVDNFVTGSKFTEIDTGDVYYFDEDANSGSEWVKPTPGS